MKQHYYLGMNSQGLHRLAYTSWGNPTDRPLICVHGFTRNSRDFDILAQHLSQQGYWVICPDIVGRGQSDWLLNAADYNYNIYLQDIVALLARLNVERVDWLGTSLGGLLGIALASKINTPIQRLILNDIGPEICADGIKRLQSYAKTETINFNSIDQADRYFRTILNSSDKLSNEAWRHLAKNSIKPNKVGGYTLRTDPAITISKPKASDQLFWWQQWEQVRCPALVIHGELSDILLPETIVKMKQHHRRFETVVIPEVGHAPALMDPEQISIIEHWLKKS